MKTKWFRGWWFRSLGLAGILFAVSAALSAHHSEVVYDDSRTIELKGTVTEFRWANPHATIHFTARNAQGVQEEWIAEMGPVGGLVRSGWNKTTIKAGDRDRNGISSPQGRSPAHPVYQPGCKRKGPP